MTAGESLLRGMRAASHTNDDGVRTSDGWKKFDFEDVLVAAEGDLPI